ncbi:hypothetical protein LTS17_003842 [Exophiala oligosperma]
MVTTRLQERLGLDTPNSSSVEDTSNSTASPSVSRASRKRSARGNETPKDSAKARASQSSLETEQTSLQPSQSQIDTPVTTNEQNLLERLKSPVEFYTPAPAKTPTNKRKRFDSDEPEDSILDMFQTPAEYPRARDVATEEEEQGDDDSDAAPEVVSTRSSARRTRYPPGSASKSSGIKRRRTATLTGQDKGSDPASGSGLIDVVKPNSTSIKTTTEGDDYVDVHDPATSTEQAPEGDVPATNSEDKDQIESVANTVDNQILTDSDTTVTALPSTSLPNGEEEDQSAVAEVEDTSTAVVERTFNGETLDDQRPRESNDHEDDPSSSSAARTDQRDKASSHVQFETTTPSSRPRSPIAAVTNPTTTTAAAPKQSVPISSIRSTVAHPQSQTNSSHQFKKAKTAKSLKISARRQPASALVHQHLPKPKPTSLQDFRSRMFNRHARTTKFGAPGQKKVKFVSA